MTRHKRHSIKLRSMYQWHRYIGVAISFLVIHISVTGIMLNHTSTLELDRKHVSTHWLLDWYGIQAPENITSVNLENIWISQWGSAFYFNEQLLGMFSGQLKGVIKLKQNTVIALTDSLLLLTRDGQILEQLRSEHGLPDGIRSLGLIDANKPVILTDTGIFISDENMMVWNPIISPTVKWSILTPLPTARYQTLDIIYRGNKLTLERLTQDLHSGRILHKQGVYFTDIIAILLIFMACSGLWIWAVRIYRNKQRGKK